MDWFASRLETNGPVDGRLFITSEQDTSHPDPGRCAWQGDRRYSIRVADDTGRVSTVGRFGQYPDLAAAQKALARLMYQDLGTGRWRVEKIRPTRYWRAITPDGEQAAAGSWAACWAYACEQVQR